MMEHLNMYSISGVYLVCNVYLFIYFIKNCSFFFTVWAPGQQCVPSYVEQKRERKLVCCEAEVHSEPSRLFGAIY
jgi:hypothetical protein